MTKLCRWYVLTVLSALMSLDAARGIDVEVGHAALGADIKGLGICPTYATVANLDRSTFGGDWYVYQQSDNSIENLWACKKVIYSKLTMNSSTNFESLGADSFGNANQFVVATDNENFAIVRACTNFGLFNQQYVHVLTRDREPSAEAITKINAALATSNIQQSQVFRTQQAGCS